MLLDLSTLNRYDPSEMHNVYDRWAELARESYDSEIAAVDFHGIDNIVFAGMMFFLPYYRKLMFMLV